MTFGRNRDWKQDGSLSGRTLAVYPEASYLRSNVALGEWHSGDRVEALRQLQIAMASEPEAPEPPATIGVMLYEEGKYAEAIPWLQRAIALKAGFALPHVYQALARTKMGDSAQAEAEFQRAVEISPLDSFVRISLGQFYLDEGRPRDAQTEFLAAISTDASEVAWQGLAQADTLLGASQQAAEAWTKVISFNPFDSGAHLGLARIYVAAGRSEQAGKEFEECLQMDPRNNEALAGLRDLQAKAGLSTAGRH